MARTPQSSGRSTGKRRPPVGRPFKPGQSGNPGGLPKTHREVRALALVHSTAAVERLVELMRQRKAPSVALGAATAIMDRAGLKPFAVEPERHDVTFHDPAGAVEALRARLAGIAPAPAAPDGAGEPE
jgi:hypothetical protein